MQSQNSKYEGLIVDSLNVGLANVNVLAIPENKDDKIRFSITGLDGSFLLVLKNNSQYNIEISHIGYKKLIDTIKIKKDLFKTYRMEVSNESLSEIILTDRQPIKIREDTITYRIEKFTNGQERKLRDVLKKLPGIEVDSDGNVKVNGKSVTKLLVEDRVFFTGDEKLGVNNIPADAIDEIDILDNYNEISFLKGLNDSKQLALNIKLKKNKKRFVFGDVLIGGGVKRRFQINPKLFYYSPKTSVNFINDNNNIGKKSFTIRDFIQFEGGFRTNIKDYRNSYSNIINNEISQFLIQQDAIFNRNNFNAINLSTEITSGLRLDSYSIYSKNFSESRQETLLTYFSDSAFDENRTNSLSNNTSFSLNKLKLQYIGKRKLIIKYEVSLKSSNSQNSNNLSSESVLGNNFINSVSSPKNLDITQKIDIKKQINKNHTYSLISSYKHSDTRNKKTWRFNQEIFPEIISFDNDSIFQLNQNNQNRINDLKINLKHYWVLNSTNHIYPQIGINLLNQNYLTDSSQELSSGNQFLLNQNEFGNRSKLRLSESYFGLEYKIRLNNFTFKPSVFLNYYDWNISQENNTLRNTGKAVLLPSIQIDWKINNTEKVNFDYRIDSQFTNLYSLSNRLIINNFNSLFRGNEFLENELQERLTLSYSKFSFFSGIFFNAGANYTNKFLTIRNNTILDGINQINSPIIIDIPEKSFVLNSSISKEINKYKFTFNGLSSFLNYTRVINNNFEKFNSSDYTYGLVAKTKYDKLPNIEIGWNQQFTFFKNNNLENNFVRAEPFINLEYDLLEEFSLKAEYKFTHYKNRRLNQVNNFQIANLLLNYHKESSAWDFGFSAQNIFDVDFKNQNSFNQFLITDSRQFVQPRIFLLTISYKI